jgi:hypothetical protein
MLTEAGIVTSVFVEDILVQYTTHSAGSRLVAKNFNE